MVCSFQTLSIMSFLRIPFLYSSDMNLTGIYIAQLIKLLCFKETPNFHYTSYRLQLLASFSFQGTKFILTTSRWRHLLAEKKNYIKAVLTYARGGKVSYWKLIVILFWRNKKNVLHNIANLCLIYTFVIIKSKYLNILGTTDSLMIKSELKSAMINVKQ